MKLIGRAAQMRKIENLFSEKSLGLTVIHGRKGMGVSSLLLQMSASHNSTTVLFCGLPVRDAYMARRESAVLRSALAGVPETDFRSQEEVLRYLLERSRTSPILLLFDDFHQVLRFSPDFCQVLNRLLSQYRASAHMQILLGGESAHMPQRLLNMADCLIFLTPLSRDDACAFYPDLPDEDQDTLYRLLGSVPDVLARINPMQSAVENIQHLLIDRHAPLQDFVPSYIAQHFRLQSPAVYSILDAMSRGANSYKEILDGIEDVTSQNLAVILKRMCALGLINRTEGKKEAGKRQEITYTFHDPLIRFYFRFLLPNLGALKTLPASEFMRTFVLTENHYDGDPSLPDFARP